MKATSTIARATLAGLFLMALTPMSSATDLPQYLNFDGQLLDSSGNPIVGATSVVFEIYNPAKDCLLYKETQTITLVAADLGEFSTKIGPNAGGTASPDDGDISWYSLFQNSGQVRSSGTFCSTSYIPAAGDARVLHVIVNGTALSPDFVLAPAPMASVAQTLQGKVPSDFLEASPTSFISTLKADLQIDNNKKLMLGNAASPSSQFVGLKAPGGLTGSYTLTLPMDDGISGQILTTDGNGVLSWIPPGGGGGITSINGDNTSSQSFAAVASGTTLGWSNSPAHRP